MRRTVRKYFIDYEKEEKWINEMAAKGLALVSVGLCRYEFEDCAPGEYTVRLELLENLPNHAESEKYLAFLEETGAEYVGSMMRWVYLRKKTEDGPFELFSDNASRIKHLTGIIRLSCIVGGVNLYLGAYNFYLYFTLDSVINLVGIVSFVLGGLCLYVAFRTNKKRKVLKEEQNIFE